MEKKPDLMEVLRRYGVEVKTAQGRRVNALCPFHKESRPSFSVDPDQGLWFCFHDYIGGDSVDLIGSMKFGLHTWDAHDKEMFKEVLSIIDQEELPCSKVETEEKKARKPALSRDVLFLLGHVSEIYHHNLLKNPQAMAYLNHRGLPEDFIRSRKIGFASGNLGVMLSMLPETVTRELAVEAGLIYVNEDNRRWEFLKGRITFPDLDRSGRVLGMIGRRLNPKQNPKYLTLTGLPKVIWGLNRFSSKLPVIVHESIMDACTAQLMGVPSISTCGTGIAWHLVDELAKRPFLGFLSQDDDPSRRAVKRWHEKLPHGRVVQGTYEGHKDLNEMATAVGWDAARDHLYRLLEEAGFAYKYGGEA